MQDRPGDCGHSCYTLLSPRRHRHAVASVLLGTEAPWGWLRTAFDGPGPEDTRCPGGSTWPLSSPSTRQRVALPLFVVSSIRRMEIHVALLPGPLPPCWALISECEFWTGGCGHSAWPLHRSSLPSRRPQDSTGTWSLCRRDGLTCTNTHLLAFRLRLAHTSHTRSHITARENPGRAGRLVLSGLRVRKLRPELPSLKESSRERLLFGVS